MSLPAADGLAALRFAVQGASFYSGDFHYLHLGYFVVTTLLFARVGLALWHFHSGIGMKTATDRLDRDWQVVEVSHPDKNAAFECCGWDLRPPYQAYKFHSRCLTKLMSQG
ncbi:hypothetical protein ACUY1T_09750 [Billgrantia sp. Q4P2]|uniref:hypothetical protein n=1 Tax=Billgrantia sp. Q4P2 TaxID=3463857 RepID=UPI004055C721